MPKRSDLDGRLKGKEAMDMNQSIIKRARSSDVGQFVEMNSSGTTTNEDPESGVIFSHCSFQKASSSINCDRDADQDDDEMQDQNGKYFGFEEDATWDEKICANSDLTLFSAYTALL